MGLLSFFKSTKDYLESANIGENWAERVIEAAGPGYESQLPFEVDEDFVQGLGEEYSRHPNGFYEGFRHRWNEHVEEVQEQAPRQDGLLGNMRRFLSQ